MEVLDVIQLVEALPETEGSRPGYDSRSITYGNRTGYLHALVGIESPEEYATLDEAAATSRKGVDSGSGRESLWGLPRIGDRRLKPPWYVISSRGEIAHDHGCHSTPEILHALTTNGVVLTPKNTYRNTRAFSLAGSNPVHPGDYVLRTDRHGNVAVMQLKRSVFYRNVAVEDDLEGFSYAEACDFGAIGSVFQERFDSVGAALDAIIAGELTLAAPTAIWKVPGAPSAACLVFDHNGKQQQALGILPDSSDWLYEDH